MTALGLRINNPLNLTFRPQDKWVGLVGQEQGKCCFDTPQHAFRAYMEELQLNVRRGVNTVPKWIRVWSKTDQAAYIVNVLRWSHMLAAQVIDPETDALPLFKAMCRQEDGSDPYPDSVIAEGIAMAQEKPVTDTPTTMATVMAHPATTRVITGAGVAGFIAVELAKFHLYDMSSIETVALGVILTIIYHRLFPQGLTAE